MIDRMVANALRRAGVEAFKGLSREPEIIDFVSRGIDQIEKRAAQFRQAADALQAISDRLKKGIP